MNRNYLMQVVPLAIKIFGSMIGILAALVLSSNAFVWAAKALGFTYAAGQLGYIFALALCASVFVAHVDLRTKQNHKKMLDSIQPSEGLQED